MQVSVGVIVLFLEVIVALQISHLLAVVSVKDANLVLQQVQFAFSVVEKLMHDRGDSLAHH